MKDETLLNQIKNSECHKLFLQLYSKRTVNFKQKYKHLMK